MFPDAAPLHLSRIVIAMERAGLVTDHVEGFADDYAETLRHWARRLDERLDEAIRIGGAERVRVWRSTCAPPATASSGFTNVYQVRCGRRLTAAPGGESASSPKNSSARSATSSGRSSTTKWLAPGTTSSSTAADWATAAATVRSGITWSRSPKSRSVGTDRSAAR